MNLSFLMTYVRACFNREQRSQPSTEIWLDIIIMKTEFLARRHSSIMIAFCWGHNFLLIYHPRCIWAENSRKVKLMVIKALFNCTIWVSGGQTHKIFRVPWPNTSSCCHIKNWTREPYANLIFILLQPHDRSSSTDKPGKFQNDPSTFEIILWNFKGIYG